MLYSIPSASPDTPRPASPVAHADITRSPLLHCTSRPVTLVNCITLCFFFPVATPVAMAARAALARSVRPLLLRRGVATTTPAAAAAAVATTGASLRAELEKLQRFSPNLPEETAAVLMTPEVRADVAAITAAEEALMGAIDTTDVSVDWVGCPISVLPSVFTSLLGGSARSAGEVAVPAVSLPPYVWF